ncbi:MAG: hypothetical protein IT442_02415 [Phycisphaeraceae bacterium]|nr:hypothetical protein [Phycisphaeraceae bacterium]
MRAGGVVVGLILALATANLAVGQTLLSKELLTTTTTLKAEQEETVKQFIQERVDQLTGGDDAQVLDARRGLMGPLEKEASQIFRQVYSSYLRADLVTALDNDRLLVRLNAMILAGSLDDQNAIELVKKGLSDTSSAVRYRAAVAGHRLLTGVRFDTRTDRSVFEQELLTAIGQRVQKEDSPYVWRPMLETLGQLAQPEARQLLVEALNQRVAAHAANVRLTPDPERAALGGLYRRIVQEVNVPGGSVDRATLRAVALTSYRYFALAAQVLAEPDGETAVTGDYQRLLVEADVFLRWTVERLTATPVQIKPLEPLIKGGLWEEAVLQAQQWQEVMAASPLAFPAQDLVMPMAATQPETAE